LALFFRHRSVSDPVFPCSSFRHLFSQPTSLAAEIAGDDGKDYFVHATGLLPDVTINEGDKVSFEVVEGEKGPKADKVSKQ